MYIYIYILVNPLTGVETNGSLVNGLAVDWFTGCWAGWLAGWLSGCVAACWAGSWAGWVAGMKPRHMKADAFTWKMQVCKPDAMVWYIQNIDWRINMHRG